ncbi:hypothetical protein BGZ99_009864 [Dissophora globulifera]|uniref:Uncharacterized protein n=1 Tax=Dissophora globulifera TaxID=979702 RepID=A0A9P6UXQ9_9FUNG|nr:hypothetical protein BGZ99_009864 [Dissophora globulifera]
MEYINLTTVTFLVTGAAAGACYVYANVIEPQSQDQRALQAEQAHQELAQIEEEKLVKRGSNKQHKRSCGRLTNVARSKKTHPEDDIDHHERYEVHQQIVTANPYDVLLDNQTDLNVSSTLDYSRSRSISIITNRMISASRHAEAVDNVAPFIAEPAATSDEVAVPTFATRVCTRPEFQEGDHNPCDPVFDNVVLDYDRSVTELASLQAILDVKEQALASSESLVHASKQHIQDLQGQLAAQSELIHSAERQSEARAVKTQAMVESLNYMNMMLVHQLKREQSRQVQDQVKPFQMQSLRDSAESLSQSIFPEDQVQALQSRVEDLERKQGDAVKQVESRLDTLQRVMEQHRVDTELEMRQRLDTALRERDALQQRLLMILSEKGLRDTDPEGGVVALNLDLESTTPQMREYSQKLSRAKDEADDQREVHEGAMHSPITERDRLRVQPSQESDKMSTQDEEIKDLQEELRSTREQLQTAVMERQSLISRLDTIETTHQLYQSQYSQVLQERDSLMDRLSVKTSAVESPVKENDLFNLQLQSEVKDVAALKASMDELKSDKLATLTVKKAADTELAGLIESTRARNAQSDREREVISLTIADLDRKLEDYHRPMVELEEEEDEIIEFEETIEIPFHIPLSIVQH